MRRLPAAAAAALFADWLLTAFTWLTWNRRPGLGQDSFLINALDLRERGQLTLGNDHPLYAALLALWVSREPAAFTWSKLSSLGWGALTLGAAFLAGRALFGWRAALAGAALLSVNWPFLSLSMSLRAEVLLPLFFLGAWAGAALGFRRDARWFALSGACAGLALLTKGTGTLLALCFAAAFVPAVGREPRLRPGAAWYAAGFLPLAGLLWWANASVLGDPFYNYSTRHAFWLDTWWDAAATPLAEQSLSGFVARHGWGGLPRRLLSGMASFAPAWLATLAPSSSFPLFHLLRWPLLGAAAWCLWAARRRAWDALRRRDGAALYPAALVTAFFPLFSWYHQVSPSERFVAPLSPMLFLLLAAAAEPEARRLPERLRPWGLGLLAALTLLGVGLKAALWGVSDPFAADRPEPCYAEAMAWVATREGRVLYGPSADLSTWPLPRPQAALSVPDAEAPKDLAAWLRARGARSAVVDWDMARRPFLAAHVESLPEGGVRVKTLPEGWREAGRDKEHDPPHLVLLEEAPALAGQSRGTVSGHSRKNGGSPP